MVAAARSAVEMYPRRTEGSDGYLQMMTPFPVMTSPAGAFLSSAMTPMMKDDMPKVATTTAYCTGVSAI